MRLASIIMITTALLATLATAPSADGQCRTRVYAPTYYATPTYHAPTYAAPAPTYHAPAYVEKVKVVKVAPQYYGYYDIPLSDQLDLVADAVAWRYAKLLLAKELLKSGGGTGTGGGTVPPMPPPTDPAPARATSKSASALQAVVTSQCIRCHAGGRNKIDLSNLDVVPMDKRRSAALLVDRGIMPEGGSPLPDTVVRLFDAWAGITARPPAKR